MGSFLFLAQIIFLNQWISALIPINVLQVKANTENQANDYEIVEFMVKKFKGVFGWS